MKYRRLTIFTFLIVTVVGFGPLESTSLCNPLFQPRTDVSGHHAAPLFVLMAHFWPYREVYASDPPDFVLYEDGTLIYYRLKDMEDRYSGRFLFAKLTPEEVAVIKRKINPQAFYTFKERYRPRIKATHEPNRFMVLRRPDGSYKSVSVYGSLRGTDKDRLVEDAPDALIEAIEFVEEYHNSKAREWVPEYFEVVIWPAREKSNKTVKWPKGWPNLTSSQTIKHKGCERYSLYIHKSHEKVLSNLLFRQWKSQAAFQIDGRRWSAELRIPFTSEMIWLNAGGFKIRECD